MKVLQAIFFVDFIVNFFYLVFWKILVGCSENDTGHLLVPIWKILWFELPLITSGKIIVCTIVELFFILSDILVFPLYFIYRIIRHFIFAFWYLFGTDRETVKNKWKYFWDDRDTYYSWIRG
jgi:hypothetical protein